MCGSQSRPVLRPTAYLAFDLVGDGLRVLRDVGLSEPEDGPPAPTKLGVNSAIALHIAPDLRHPIRSVVSCLEPGDAILELSAVPKVAVNEDGGARASEHDVRSPGQIPHVNAVAEATSMEPPPEFDLRPRVPLPAGGAGRPARGLRGGPQRCVVRCDAAHHCPPARSDSTSDQTLAPTLVIRPSIFSRVRAQAMR